jgi:hypothetical protein
MTAVRHRAARAILVVEDVCADRAVVFTRARPLLRYRRGGARGVSALWLYFDWLVNSPGRREAAPAVRTPLGHS